MDEVKISVIVPVYNSEKHIEKCLDSILNQSLKEIEVVVINDGSTDNSYEILKNYKDERLKIINQKNYGVSVARNNALKNSKGKYIIFLDSDDWIEKKYFEMTFRRAEVEKLDLVVTDYYYDTSSRSEYAIDLNIDNNKVISGYEYFEYLFSNELKGFNWNKLIRKDILIDNDIFYDNNINLMEDLLFLIKILKNVKKVGKINQPFYHYVQHELNTTKKIKKSHLKSIEKVFFQIKNQEFISKDLKEKIKEKEAERLWWAYFNLTESIDENYFLNIYYKKLKNIKIKKYRLFLLMLKYFPNKTTIKIIKKIYLIKKMKKGL